MGSLFKLLFEIVVMPLCFIFEAIFVAIYRVFNDPGIAIIGVSLAVNFLVLPLYRKADEIQTEERVHQKKMEKWTKHIKSTFKGDERSMMLQAYYREENYNPIYGLRNSISLLLQIPFFMAAYRFLSSLTLLEGAPFWFLSDLSKPDQLLTIGSFTINILPVLMTVINCISGIIYTRGLPAKEKIQLFTIAGVFLLLLYDSPSGLVFYWTLNNLFSLAKNIFLKLLNKPRIVFGNILIVCAVIGYVWLIYNSKINTFLSQFITICLLLFAIVFFALSRSEGKRIHICIPENTKLFWGGNLLLTLMIGVYVPSQLIASSPTEFINRLQPKNPIQYVITTASYAAGLILLWLTVFYLMSSENVRSILCLLAPATALSSIICIMFFGGKLGTLHSNLTFDSVPAYSGTEIVLNSMIIGCVVLLLSFILRSNKCQALLVKSTMILCIATSVLSFVSLKKIYTVSNSALKTNSNYIKISEPIIHLSKDGKNVVVLMLDRAIGAYPEFIFNEKPELATQFSGFVWYPNAVSFGGYTNFSTPSLFGGYEYTPYEINKRSSESLASKHNEALLVLPTVLSEADVSVTICDPPYAGYKDIPDLSIFNGLKGVSSYITRGNCKIKDGEEIVELSMSSLQRNMLWYAFFKASPIMFQPSIYDDGNYFNLSTNYAHNTVFLEAYSVLNNLIDMTDFTAEGNTALLMANLTTHEPERLQLPDYKPVANPNNADFEDQWDKEVNNHRMLMDPDESIRELQINHYMVNVASYDEIGEWLNYLKENEVYDNTKIIIVSDHGRNLHQFDYLWYEEQKLDIEWYNPLFMVKDYGNDGPWQMSNEFMTLADVPSLTLAGLVDHAKNPNTGKEISMECKKSTELRIPTSDRWRLTDDNVFDTTQWAPSALSDWYVVKDNIFDFANWIPVGD